MTDILKPRAISGFPEWLPEDQAVEDRFIHRIREVFESFGYAHLETSAVELLDVLVAKGVESKEIYTLQRLQAEEGEKSRFGLHFDLTVPFARYVALHQGQLSFPFKRYQIQKVWRGERPAQGRFREFYQCDIDVVGIDHLPSSFDAELLDVMGRVFARLELGQVGFRVNHRRLLQGFYESLGVGEDRFAAVLIEVDKIEKLGPEAVGERLAELGLNQDQIEAILKFACDRCGREGLRDHLQSFGIDNELFREGMEDLCSILDQVPEMENVSITWDGSITRGLNYYTGIIFETELEGAASLGSICSGGRYDDLCGRFSKARLPGVGISLGLSRLLSHLLAPKDSARGSSSPTQVFVVSMSERRRGDDVATAQALRDVGWKVELSPLGKMKKLLNQANRRGCPVVVIPNSDGTFEWKDMLSGEQQQLSREELLQRSP